MFTKLLKRPDIDKSYAMVKKTDSWYETIVKIHNSLNEVQKFPHQMLEIISHDNLKLKAVYYPSEKSSNITVIFLHGFGSHPEREGAFPALFYLSLGYNVLIPYQRAHGLSEGDFISFGAKECADLLCWIDKINEMNSNNDIIIHGLSMGGGIALAVSDKVMKNVKGIIAESPNASIKNAFLKVAKMIFKKNYEKVVSYALERFEKEFGVDAGNFESVDIVSKCKYPILLSAGSNESFDELLENIKNANPNNTEIIILPDCDHANGMYKQTELYQKKIKEFLKNVIDDSADLNEVIL